MTTREEEVLVLSCLNVHTLGEGRVGTRRPGTAPRRDGGLSRPHGSAGGPRLGTPTGLLVVVGFVGRPVDESVVADGLRRLRDAKDTLVVVAGPYRTLRVFRARVTAERTWVIRSLTSSSPVISGGHSYKKRKKNSTSE